MGYTTVVTCDQCGKDITNEGQTRLVANAQATTPPDPEAEHPMPTVQTQGAETILCDEHATGVWAKIEKLTVLPAKK